MQKQLLYSDAQYARVKWYLVSSGREGTIEDIINVTRNGVLKAGQIQEQLHQEGIIDLYEVRAPARAAAIASNISLASRAPILPL